MQIQDLRTIIITTNRGQAALTAVVLLLGISLALVGGYTSLALSHADIEQTNRNSAQGYFTAEAGQEDVVYRLRTGRNVSNEEVIHLAGSSATTTIADIAGGKRAITRSDKSEHVRAVETEISAGQGASFNYGVQAGAGGFVIQNLASVDGNVYSNGPIIGDSWNEIKGEAISAGPDGQIDDIRASGSIYAHTIENAFTEKDAYYQTITNTVVLGSEFAGSSDKPTSTLPIADSVIEQWKAAAEAGGTITCSDGDTHKIDDDITIGPVKIPCDLEISRFSTVTLAGPVWIEGDVDIRGFPRVRVASSIGGKSVPIIADNPANPTESGRVDIRNLVRFEGSGADGSYVLVVSQNTSAEEGGDENAIRVRNGVSGELLVYAAHGNIEIENLTSLREVSAYKITLQNLAEVKYETGLVNTLFESGPGGGYDIVDWKEVE